MNKKGFTLTEILVVIVLIGVILGIAIPSVVEVRKRINERLLDEKKSEILSMAEVYASDKKLVVDTYINVYDLINEDYINSDVKQNEGNCTGANTQKGCIINPVDNTSMNNERLLIRVKEKSFIAVWDEGEGSIINPTNLVEIVKSDLNCTTQNNKVNEGKCVYGLNSSEEPNNYLYYSGIMWRILGVYKIDNKEVAKLISNDNVVWEISA